jgi:hypothetical protein
LIAGQPNPKVLAGMARGRMRLRHDDLVEALTGQFDDHHAELAPDAARSWDSSSDLAAGLLCGKPTVIGHVMRLTRQQVLECGGRFFDPAQCQESAVSAD